MHNLLPVSEFLRHLYTHLRSKFVENRTLSSELTTFRAKFKLAAVDILEIICTFRFRKFTVRTDIRSLAFNLNGNRSIVSRVEAIPEEQDGERRHLEKRYFQMK
jgi:hypothetical protein